MPGKFAQFRELPSTMKQVTTLAIAAIFISVIALVVSLGARHAS